MFNRLRHSGHLGHSYLDNRHETNLLLVTHYATIRLSSTWCSTSNGLSWIEGQMHTPISGSGQGALRSPKQYFNESKVSMLSSPNSGFLFLHPLQL